MGHRLLVGLERQAGPARFSMSTRVVVTGAGTVSALGDDWQTVRNRLQSGVGAIRYMPEWERYTSLGTRLAAPVDDFTLPDTFTRKRRRSMGRVAELAVVATERALDDAGLANDPLLSSGEVGIAYGSATGSSTAAMEFFALLERGTAERMDTTTYLRMMSHTAAVNIGIRFGITGRVMTTSSACTAGSQGLGYAFEAIRDGRQTIMIAGGAEELCPTQAATFDIMMAASRRNDEPALSSRPFDADRDGLVLGEGSCTLILESMEHALARGASILGEIVGFATNSDGAHVVRPRVETVQRVMQEALKVAGLSAHDIDAVNVHATATQHGDIVEGTATGAVFGSQTPVMSLKGHTGHTLGACGAFEAWCSLGMLRDGWLAPTLNLSSPDPACGDLDHVTGSGRDKQVQFIISNNFAFGGINTSLVLAGV